LGRPTERALKRKPRAVVLFAWLADKTNEAPGDADFEWFEKSINAKRFFDKATVENDADVEENDWIVHVLAEITDTSTMALGRVHVSAADDATKQALLERFTKGEDFVVPPEPKEKRKAVVKAPRKVAPIAKVAADATAKPRAKRQAVRPRIAIPKPTS